MEMTPPGSDDKPATVKLVYRLGPGVPMGKLVSIPHYELACTPDKPFDYIESDAFELVRRVNNLEFVNKEDDQRLSEVHKDLVEKLRLKAHEEQQTTRRQLALKAAQNASAESGAETPLVTPPPDHDVEHKEATEPELEA